MTITFAPRQTAPTTISDASAAPPTPPASNPSASLPERLATANPENAPIIIIPSIPRLKMPARSDTASPIAASAVGTARRTPLASAPTEKTAAMSATTEITARVPRRRGTPSGQNKTLHHEDEVRRDTGAKLHRLASVCSAENRIAPTTVGSTSAPPSATSASAR